MGMSTIQKESKRISTYIHLIHTVTPNLRRVPGLSKRPTLHSFIKHKEDIVTNSGLLDRPGIVNFLCGGVVDIK